MKVHWVPQKHIDLDAHVKPRIDDCFKSCVFTNNGKYVNELQQKFKGLLSCKGREVLAACNGTAALHAIINGFNIHFYKKLRWAVQSFTFPSSIQGPLEDALIFDLDPKYLGPSTSQLIEQSANYDGIIVTNCFGLATDIAHYEKLAQTLNKLLVFDNAASPLTTFNGKNLCDYGDASMVSLHHTKPIGFGEGGIMVFKSFYSNSMQRAICFGYTASDRLTCFNPSASNYKMSEISAIYILGYLQHVNEVERHHKKMKTYFMSLIKDLDIHMFPSFAVIEDSFCSTIPILFSLPTSSDVFTVHGIEAKKYYYPLTSRHMSPIAYDLFERLVCLPLNIDTTKEDIDLYIKIIRYHIST